jgi:2-C-methyl-D-erythritol 4-phosphate cytidylyltransferase
MFYDKELNADKHSKFSLTSYKVACVHARRSGVRCDLLVMANVRFTWRKITMIYAVILAGGKGSRVGTNVPKQFLKLGGRTILLRTIDVFLDTDMIDIIYIVVNEMWLGHTKELLDKSYDTERLKRFKVICGGKERIMSFLNAIYDIHDIYGINPEDMVLSHDAVRPFVSREIIEDCIEKTKKYRVAMASVSSADTIYASQEEGFLTSTYDRKTIYYGQTPQGCMMDFMYEVIESYMEDELLSMTGTSQLFINKGIKVKISLGTADNFKITTLRDIDLARYLYGEGTQ